MNTFLQTVGQNAHLVDWMAAALIVLALGVLVVKARFWAQDRKLRQARERWERMRARYKIEPPEPWWSE